jgi:hypothetical protein
MANPKFVAVDASETYTWADLPVLPSDRPDLPSYNDNQQLRTRVDVTAMEYADVAGQTIGRKHITKRGLWTFTWHNISQSMVESLQVFALLSRFRFYPDSSKTFFFTVYIDNEFAPALKRGGTYDLTLELKEYGYASISSSSSSST